MMTVGIGVFPCFFWAFLLALLHSTATDIQTYEYQRWYNENLIARKFAPMAAAAYGKKEKVEQCLEAVFPHGAVLVKHVEMSCRLMLSAHVATGSDLFTCAAFIALASSDKAIILSFRGTDKADQFVDTLLGTFLVQQSAPPAGSAHAYFMHVFTALTEGTGLFEELLETLSEYPDYELWVTGHSLGGALASLAAGKLVKDFNVPEENMKLVTFGQPRTGDREWAYEMDRLIKTYKYRVVSGDDIVAVVPFDLNIPITVPWPKPIGEKLYYIDLGSKWLHWTGEVWYPGGAQIGAQFKMCNQTNEPDGCSGLSTIAKKFIAHILGVISNSIGVDCVTEILDGFKNFFEGFDANCKLKLEFWDSCKFTVDLPDDVGENIKKCFERKFQLGKFHADKIKELFGNFMGHHRENFGFDYKGLGDKGCDGLNS